MLFGVRRSDYSAATICALDCDVVKAGVGLSSRLDGILQLVAR